MKYLIDRSPSIENLSKALGQFNKLLEGKQISKDAKNPFFKSTYATLANVLEVIRPLLNKAGLSVIQGPVMSEAGPVFATTLIENESGQFITYIAPLPSKANPTAQELGSLITYFRRYCLLAILNIPVADDDDGNLASSPVKFS